MLYAMPLFDLTGETVKDRYEIGEELGRGGFGAVYKAWDVILEVPVAVKTLFDNSPHQVKQFHLEARILAKLHHPGLPRVTDYFSDMNRHFLVMDYIDGRDLQEIARSGIPPVESVLEWMMQVLETLTCIHGKDVIHRDIKPGNVKISREGKAYLVDFGIAKTGSRMHTAPGARGAFTPHMASPEQCQTAGRTTPASDLYSVGATMYYILTGNCPADAVSRLAGKPLEDPARFNPMISPDLTRVIRKSMELDPFRRYKDAKSMREDLQEILSLMKTTTGPQGQGTPSPPPNPGAQAAQGNNPPPFRRDIRRR